MCRSRATAAALLLLSLCWLEPSAASADDALRVCADPNSLPFSNRDEAGLENELARLVAGALGMELEYFWWPQRRGFIRNTLRAQRCDVVMAVPAGDGPLLTTKPYYRSSYVFVRRRGTPPLLSLDDPQLRRLKVGVHLIGDDAANAPPAHSLAQRGIVDNVVGFMVYGDYASPDPERPIIDAVASGSLDVAIVWGPLAGYYAQRAAAPLELTPVAPLVDGVVRLSFAISMGVRRSDAALKARLDGVLDRHRREIAAILERYGVPRLDVEPGVEAAR